MKVASQVPKGHASVSTAKPSGWVFARRARQREIAITHVAADDSTKGYLSNLSTFGCMLEICWEHLPN